jgi:hypothetical protein
MRGNPARHGFRHEELAAFVPHGVDSIARR